MKRRVSIFIEGLQNSGDYQRIDLFDDETIKINSSVQNIQDISKVFTDYSQSFNVPATPKNSNIFQYFYENALDGGEINGTYTTINVNVRRLAYIEIDNLPFRTGKIELEKSIIENGKVSNYQITFYGDLINLKDLFGESKLVDLDYSTLNFSFDGDEVKDRILNDSIDYDVRYPLISSDRFWSYGDSTITDISNSSYPIDYRELFPAIRVKSIFDLIQTKFGITFNSLFFSDARFNKLFLWYKNKLNPINTTESKIFDISSTLMDSFTTKYVNYKSSDDTIWISKNIPSINSSDSTYNYKENPISERIYININSTSNSYTKYYIDVYRGFSSSNNYNTSNVSFTLFKTIESNGTGVLQLDEITPDWNSVNKESFVYKLEVRADRPLTIDYNVYHDFKYIKIGVLKTTPYKQNNYNYDYAYVFTTTTNIGNNSISLVNNSNLGIYAPDIKIYDLISGVLKMFNLTCYPLSSTEFQVEPLYQWYNYGAVIDITNYVDTNEIEVSKHDLYKKIELKYQDSESISNKNYESTNNRKFGNAFNTFDNNGSDYSIEIPFEDLKLEKIDTDLVVGYCIDKNSQSYIPKPIFLYENEKQTKSIYFNNGTTTTDLGYYIPFTQFINYNTQKYSLNFGIEYSELYSQLVENTLFANYYYSYLKNIYDNKSRLINVKALFPISLITSMKLNDRLIIRDKRYIINQLGLDLTSGDVTLQLLTDLAPIENKNSNIINIDSGGGIFEDTIYFHEYDETVDIFNGGTFWKLVDENETHNIYDEDGGLVYHESSTKNPNLSFSQDNFTHSSLVDVTIDAGSGTTTYTEIHSSISGEQLVYKTIVQ